MGFCFFFQILHLTWTASIYKNVQATISAFWLVKNMSINPKSVQQGVIECKKCNWVQKGLDVIECKTVKLKMIDSSYFKLGETKWRTKMKLRLKLFTYVSMQLSHNETKCNETQQQLKTWACIRIEICRRRSRQHHKMPVEKVNF